jgi:tetratricopeptide (TPR) repeat protein
MNKRFTHLVIASAALVMLSIVEASAQKQGQEKIDSLLTVLKSAKEDTSKVNTLSAVCWEEIMIGEFQQARKYADEAIVLAEKIGFKNGIATGYNQSGIIYANLSDYPKSLDYLQKALTIDELLHNRAGSALNLGNIANVYDDLSDYPKSLEYNQKALAILEQMGNKAGVANTLGNIGIIYANLSDYTKALEYYQKGLGIHEQLGNKDGIARNLCNIGSVYADLPDYPKALEYDQKSLTIYEQLGNKDGIIANLGNIGTVYLDLSDYTKALEYLQKASKIAEEIGDKNSVASLYNFLGKVFQKQGKLTEALKYQTKGLSIALEIGAMNEIKDAYGNLAVIDSAMNNYKAAFEHHKLYMQYNDSIFNIEKDKKLTQIRMKYDFDKVQDSIKTEQAKKDAIKTGEIKKQKQLMYSLIIGFILILVIVLILYLKSQVNPHFLFNTLNSIYSLSIQKSDDTPSAIVMLSGMMRYVISDAALDYVSLEKELNYISDYIELQKIRLGNTVKIDYRCTGLTDEKKIAPLILINLVENAFKHGVNPEEDSHIRINILIKDSELHMDTFNNKVSAISDGTERSSIGLKNTRRRLKFLYPGNHNLTILDEANTYSVKLTINLL